MWTSKYKISATFLVATLAVADSRLPAQQALTSKAASAGSEAKSKADSAAMAETEAKLARLREIIRPQPGEHVANMAKIAWERDPWTAAVKAGKEGKPVLIYAEGAAGIACGYG